jgi:hypothetical protein
VWKVDVGRRLRLKVGRKKEKVLILFLELVSLVVDA